MKSVFSKHTLRFCRTSIFFPRAIHNRIARTGACEIRFWSWITKWHHHASTGSHWRLPQYRYVYLRWFSSFHLQDKGKKAIYLPLLRWCRQLVGNGVALPIPITSMWSLTSSREVMCFSFSDCTIILLRTPHLLRCVTDEKGIDILYLFLRSGVC